VLDIMSKVGISFFLSVTECEPTVVVVDFSSVGDSDSGAQLTERDCWLDGFWAGGLTVGLIKLFFR